MPLTSLGITGPAPSSSPPLVFVELGGGVCYNSDETGAAATLRGAYDDLDVYGVWVSGGGHLAVHNV